MIKYRAIREDKYYTELTKSTQSIRAIVFDTETYVDDIGDDRVEFRFRLGCMIKFKITNKGLIRNREIIRFNSTQEFYDEIDTFLPKRSKVFIFAHNVGFDIRVLNLVDFMLSNNWECEPPIINNRVFMWSLRKDGRTIIFLDTANFGVLSVAELGSSLGEKKGNVDFATVSDDILYTYCKKDTEIIEHFIREYYLFIMNNNLGAFKNTLASQAMCSYRTCFMDTKPFTHTNKFALNLERASYHGGRVECLFIGNPKQEGYYKLDVNSMYPYCMKKFSYPNELLYTLKYTSLDQLKKHIVDKYCIAKVIIRTSKPIYPVIMNNKLIFPIGRFITVLHHIELERAIKDNSIIKVLELCVYNKVKFFDNYVDFFYDAKISSEKKGNKAWRLISKLFMNSLYGKFGESQKNRHIVDKCDYTIFFREPCIDGDTGQKYSLIFWQGDIYKDYAEGESLISCPSIAGAVTAYARYILFTYIELAGIENCYYMDTDSLIVNRQGYNNLSSVINKYELGMLKLEGVANRVIIWGNKDYKFGKHIRTKGISVKARKINKTTWEAMQFESFLAWLTNGANGYPKGKTILKRRISSYNKGNILTNGKVTPIVVDYPFFVALSLLAHMIRKYLVLFLSYLIRLHQIKLSFYESN